MKTSITFMILSAALLISTACRKSSPEIPGPELHRLDSTLSGSPQKFGVYYRYLSDNKLTKVEDYTGNRTEYSYNAEGQVVRIFKYTFQLTGSSEVDIKVNYQNGIPVSGTRTLKPYQNKVAYPYVYLDSVRYKVKDGKVSEIKYFHRQELYSTRPDLNSLNTQYNSTHIINYEGNNWTGYTTIGSPAAKTMTYGTKKGAFSAFPMKFLLYEGDIPMLHSANELLSEQGIAGSEKTIYEYIYDADGYPSSATINLLGSAQKMTFFYK